jgi:large subunit ribosomal protein L15
MDLSKIKPAEGSVKKVKRIGRGEGSGHGGTSTRGHKGAKSRSGYSKKVGFEGGQMPLYRRIPKFGFKNFNRVEYRAINIESLQKLAEANEITAIDPQVLMDNGMIGKNDLVKVLAKGELSLKIEVKAHAFSKEAIRKIEDKGGSAIKL